jgi:hypothetical protein
MCGAPKTQEVITRAEIDPALQRLLYGGTAADPRGGFGSRNQAAGGGSSPMMDGGGGGGGGDNGGSSFGGSSSGYTSFRDMFDGGGPGLAGPTFGGALGGISNAAGFSPAEARFGDGIDRGGMYAMGGMVQPQMGLASLNQGQMPMMNGGLPNLSDPMTAATLAMAMRGPQMQYGDIMAPQMPQQRFQDGGEVSPMLRRMLAEADRVEIGGAEVSPMLQRMLAEADRVEFGGPSAPYAGTTDRVYEAGPPVFGDPSDDGGASAQLEQILEELPPQERQGLFAEAMERGIAPTPIRLLMLALARREDRKLQRQSERQGFAMGGYIEGPGTGTSDSVPAMIYQNGGPVQEAMLSDGEFVMTERAVRGAGGGDRAQGAAKMYEMMSRLERRA